MTQDAMSQLLIDTEIESFDKIGEFLDVSPRTIYMWMSKGQIPQRHHKKLQDLVYEKKNMKLKQALDKAEVGMLVRALEKRGFTVTLETK